MSVRKPNLREDLPPIDIRKKAVKGKFGVTKMVPTTKKEQRELKARLMEQYPDRFFLDDLHERNSVTCDLSWIDRLEDLDAFLE